MASRAARRSSASSRRVELTKTRSRWSGVRIGGGDGSPIRVTIAPGDSRRVIHVGVGQRERDRLDHRQSAAASLARRDGLGGGLPDGVQLRGVHPEGLRVEDADAMADDRGRRGQDAGALRIPTGGGDGAEPLQAVGDALLVVQADRDEERPQARLLGGIHFASDEQQPSLVVARHRQGEQVPARLRELGGTVESRQRLVALTEQPGQPAPGDLGDRLRPGVPHGVEPLRGVRQLTARCLDVGHRQLQSRRRPRRERHRRGILVTALAEEADALGDAGDDAVGRTLPHLAPQREEPCDGARVLRDGQLLAEQLEHPDADFREEPGDPPVDEEAPGEIPCVVEAVRVDQVTHGCAEVRLFESELRRRRLLGPDPAV